MSKLNIQGKELRAIGYPGTGDQPCMNIMQKNYKHHSKEEVEEKRK